MRSLLDAIELCRKQAELQQHAWYVYLVGDVFLATGTKTQNKQCQFVCDHTLTSCEVTK